MPSQPFNIAIPEEKIQLLHQKLDLVNFPTSLMFLAEIRRAASRYASPHHSVKEGYDWWTHEAAISSSLPQFTLDLPVDGFGTLNIHFVHQTSKPSITESTARFPWLFVVKQASTAIIKTKHDHARWQAQKNVIQHVNELRWQGRLEGRLREKMWKEESMRHLSDVGTILFLYRHWEDCCWHLQWEGCIFFKGNTYSAARSPLLMRFT